MAPNIANKVTCLKLAKNGSVCKPVTTDGKNVKVTNTCPFDSVIQSLCIAITDSEDYFKYANESRNQAVQLALRLLTNANLTEFYKLRARYLLNIYPKSPTLFFPDMITVDATDNVIKYIENNFKDEPSLTEFKICSKCSATRIEILPIMRVDRQLIMAQGVRELEQSIKSYHSARNFQKCRKPNCDGSLSIRRSLGQHIFIELDFFDPSNCLLQEQITLKNINNVVKISDFPLELNIENNKFSLVAVIVYEPGHYISYCHRIDGNWEKYNDLADSISQTNSNLQINPHSAFYILMK